MVIERFLSGPEAVLKRYNERGRMLPDGLTYIDSWLYEAGSVCFQLMETSDRTLLAEWSKNWDDLAAFEIVPVYRSAEFWARLK
jgi:hypothetical protein